MKGSIPPRTVSCISKIDKPLQKSILKQESNAFFHEKSIPHQVQHNRVKFSKIGQLKLFFPKEKGEDETNILHELDLPQISQVNQGGKVREISIYVLTLHIKLKIIRKVPFTQKIVLKF